MGNSPTGNKLDAAGLIRESSSPSRTEEPPTAKHVGLENVCESLTFVSHFSTATLVTVTLCYRPCTTVHLSGTNSWLFWNSSKAPRTRTRQIQTKTPNRLQPAQVRRTQRNLDLQLGSCHQHSLALHLRALHLPHANSSRIQPQPQQRKRKRTITQTNPL